MMESGGDSPRMSSGQKMDHENRPHFSPLIDDPLNDSMNIIDVETTEAVYHTDSELKEFLSNTHGVSNPLMVQSLEKSRRNYILKSMKDYGAGIRQLSRLTGVSYGVIQKL